MHSVIPAILPKTKEELEAGIRKLEPFVDRVHIDIIDGKFAPNTTIKGYEELNSIRTPLKFDIHLMIDDPYSQMFNWYTVGGIERFIIHAEARNGLKDLIEQVKLNNKEFCLAVNPKTYLDDVWEFAEMIDMLQIMTVEPGFQGHKFMPEVLYKISTFRERAFDMPIAVDGGINPETAKEALTAGATDLVCGSYIMQAPDVNKAINELKTL